ncbi:MAG TPA: class IV adenylate cyclase [Candidatus Binataceae bacterium]|jgi:predicted adenylyl cyclase CyaB
MRNLEAKFRVGDAALARARAEEIGFSLRGTLNQRDTFFVVANGKLKLREEADGAALIHYRREHREELEVSAYEIVPVAEPEALRSMLAEALGVIAEVRKVRTLLMRRNVRLHLDRVEGLGSFGEIEAVVAEDEAPEVYRAEVDAILATLEIAPEDLISQSYFELLSGG